MHHLCKATLGASLVLFSSCAAFGQGGPSFEVASVKPAAPPEQAGMIRVRMSGGPGSPDPGQLNYQNVTLKNVLMNAYGVKGYQISGPKWIETERFDIMAKVPKDTSKEDFKLMLQNLLVERFKMTMHKETKDLPMYALVVGKGGSKLKEVVDDTPAPGATPPGGASTSSGPNASGPSAFAPPPPPSASGGGSASFGGSFGAGGSGGAPVRITMGADGTPKIPANMMPKGGLMMMMSNGRMRVAGSGQIGQLTEMLGNQLGKPVVDNTELKAKYELTLDFAPENNGGMMGMMAPPPGHDGAGPGGGTPMASAPDNAGPSIFTALQEQMGLKLEQKKGPVEMIVIDKMEKTPTEN